MRYHRGREKKETYSAWVLGSFREGGCRVYARSGPRRRWCAAGHQCARVRAGRPIDRDEAERNTSNFDADAIVVLGAGINWDGSPSAVLKDRLEVAIELYKSGIAPKIIMSGDNSDSTYNEVMAMANYAIAQGVDEDDIFCDHAGVSTYDSMYRVKNVFSVSRCIVVTQEYHLYRALYDARAFDLDARGVASDRSVYEDKESYEKREVLARIKDFCATLINMEPETKSSPVDLDQSGTVTQWW